MWAKAIKLRQRPSNAVRTAGHVTRRAGTCFGSAASFFSVSAPEKMCGFVGRKFVSFKKINWEWVAWPPFPFLVFLAATFGAAFAFGFCARRLACAWDAVASPKSKRYRFLMAQPCCVCASREAWNQAPPGPSQTPRRGHWRRTS